MALDLAEQGWDLVLHYRSSKQQAEQTADLARAQGVQVQLVQADLAEVSGCQHLGQQAGSLDLLILSAAAYSARSIQDTDAAYWDRMQAINTRAPFLVTRACLPGLRASSLPGGGCVLLFGDIGGQRPTPGYAAYSVSKAGVQMLTAALALELAPEIRVNAINPGTVLPPEDLSQDAAQAILRTIPLARFGSAQDIVRAMRFVVESPYLTGQCLNIDGGRSVGGPMEAG